MPNQGADIDASSIQGTHVPPPVAGGDDTYIVAEAGVNHNGSLEQARQLVDVAVEAGADAVKFQTFRADALTVEGTEKAAYQQSTTDETQSQREMLRELEISPEDHNHLLQYCQRMGIHFLSSPFGTESVRFLANDLGLARLKIPSGEITNAPLLLAAGRTGRSVILSTGMSTLGEVEEALGVLAFGYTSPGEVPSSSGFQAAYASTDGQKWLRRRVVLLHCTSEYPAPVREVNLRAMDTLRSAFNLPVGLSDHTQGTAIPMAAVGRGASVVEKHFTLDQTLPGPDHSASLEPDQLTAMIEGIRQVERARGSPRKCPTESETKNVDVVRKSLVAAQPIAAGDPFTEDNLTAKRPGHGRSPMRYWEYLSRTASENYDTNDLIKE